ncbi:MAG TPA: hypothetical protein VGJ60_14710 [Chloroflexota bacterium]
MHEIGHIVQSVIPIPGLRPELRNSQNAVVRESNLTDKLDELDEAVQSRPWLRQLLREVAENKKTSIVTLSLGALVVTTAIGAGIELGIRQGRDLREIGTLLDGLSRRKRRQRRARKRR